MNHRKSRRSMIALTAAMLAATLTACTGEADPGPTETAPTAAASGESTSDPDAATEVPGGAGVAPVPAIGVPVDGATPLGEYLVALAAVRTAATGASDGERSAWWEQVQDSIAQCMSDEGFEYMPTEYRGDEGISMPIVSQTLLAVPRLPAARADVEQFGYGIDREDGLQWGIAADSPTELANAATYDALSDEGKAAYELAFNGFDGDPASTQAWEPSCAGRASSEFPEPPIDPAAVAAWEFETLQGDIGAVWTYTAAEDPRAIALNEQWAACMADAGMPLVEDFRDIPGPDTLTAYNLAINTGPDGQPLEGAHDMASEDIPVENRTLIGSQPEIDIALADFDCRATLDYEKELAAVLVEHEADFVEANEERLQQLLAAAETAGS